jgi:putative transposase
VKDPGRLALGDWIEFENERHQILGFVGSGVRLRSESGIGQIITATALLVSATFQAGADRPTPTEEAARLEAGAVLDGLPDAERQRALDLEAHLLEVAEGDLCWRCYGPA